MKVHFACSTSKLDKYKKNYLAICDSVKDLGHVVTRDWINEAIKLYEQGHIEIDRESIYPKVVQAILTSDVIVIEGTVQSFSIGYQIALALNKNKPVLLLNYDKSNEKSYFKNSFMDGLKSPLLTMSKYNLENIEEILEDFFMKHRKGTAIKFNLILTQEIDNYLNWASFTYGVNKSEFTRQLVQKYIKEKDKRYKKYISNIRSREKNKSN